MGSKVALHETILLALCVRVRAVVSFSHLLRYCLSLHISTAFLDLLRLGIPGDVLCDLSSFFLSFPSFCRLHLEAFLANFCQFCHEFATCISPSIASRTVRRSTQQLMNTNTTIYIKAHLLHRS
jgi:hypothetical protein